MALQVWLPLNGDLHNQGLSRITVTNYGATVTNDGKIGKAYAFTNSQYMELSNMPFSSLTTCSVCFWFKLNSSETDWLPFTGQTGSYYILATGSGTGNFYHQNAGSPSKIYVDGIERLNPIRDGKWHHYCIINVNFSSWTKFYINYYGGTGSGWNWTGNMNDLRIYNHNLSIKEVKEISKGLVLHYKLDDIYSESTTNLATYSAIYSNVTYGSPFSISGWGGDTGTCTCYKTGGYNDGPYKVYHKTSTGSGGIYWKAANDIHIVAGKTYTFSVYIKASREYTDSNYSFNINRGSDNAYITYNQAVHFTTKWKRIEKTFTATSSQAGDYGEMSIIYNDDVSDYYVYYSCFQIEEKDHATPFIIGTRNGNIYDCSGYENNGTITENLTLNSDTPRYNYCTEFSSSRITSNDINLDGNNVFSISCWIKLTSSQSYQPIFWFGNGSTSQGFCLHGGSANRIEGGDGTNRFDNSSFTTIPLNTWKYLAFTYDGNTITEYVDGILTKTLSYTNKFGSTLKRIYLGYFWGGNLKGNISDFRLYSTVLSIDDIKELYHTAGSIDNQGDILGFEFDEEEIDKGQILKTGIIKINDFIEVNDCIYLPAGTWIDTGLNYNNSDTCKAETIIKYESGGTGRDLMGYSGSGSGYWGVTASGSWEPHGTFTYTNSDITKKNTIVYIFSSASEHGTYRIGALGSSYSVRGKYIYRVRLYKNNILERDLYPIQIDNKIGLFDLLHNEYYLANNTNGILKNDDIIEASIFKNKVESNQLLEI